MKKTKKRNEGREHSEYARTSSIFFSFLFFFFFGGASAGGGARVVVALCFAMESSEGVRLENLAGKRRAKGCSWQ